MKPAPVVPVFASWFMRPTAKQQAKIEAAGASEEKDTWLQKPYLPVLNWALGHRWLTLLLAVLVFAATLALVPRLKTDFIGSTGTESLAITQKLPSGTGLSETDKAATKIEGLLAADPSVQTYSTTIGSGSSAVFLAARAAPERGPVHGAPEGRQQRHGHRRPAAAADRRDGPTSARSRCRSVPAAPAPVSWCTSRASDSTLRRPANDRVLAMMQGIPGLTNVNSDLATARDMLSVDVKEGRRPTWA